MIFTDKLEYLLEEKRISKRKFAEDLVIPYTTIMGWYAKGSEQIKRSYLVKIADYFGVTLDFIIDDRIALSDIDEHRVVLKKEKQNDDSIKMFFYLNNNNKKKVGRFIDYMLEGETEKKIFQVFDADSPVLEDLKEKYSGVVDKPIEYYYKEKKMYDEKYGKDLSLSDVFKINHLEESIKNMNMQLEYCNDKLHRLVAELGRNSIEINTAIKGSDYENKINYLALKNKEIKEKIEKFTDEIKTIKLKIEKLSNERNNTVHKDTVGV